MNACEHQESVEGCPSCGDAGQSVAAMNYAETKEWSKSGRLSGSGVGVGTAGVGVMVGGGSYSETGTVQTKRARVFAEPSEYRKPVLGIVFIGLLMAVGLSGLPTRFGGIFFDAPRSSAVTPQVISAEVERSHRDAPATPKPVDRPPEQVSDRMERMSADLLAVAGYILPFVALLIIGIKVREAWQNQVEEDRLNAEVLPQERARYGELRYCDKCHILFDGHGMSERADAAGFERMMSRRQVAS